MLLLLFLTTHLTIIKLELLNILHRWYFANEKAYIITSDYVFGLQFKGDSVLVDTLVPRMGMNNLVFKVDTFDIYRKRDGLYLNKQKILSETKLFDIGFRSNIVGILSEKSVYLLRLTNQKVDTIKLNQKFISITLTDSGFYLVSPELLITFYNLSTSQWSYIDAKTLSEYIPIYGIERKGKGVFWRGGITGVYPYFERDINTLIWGFYYSESDVLISTPYTFLLFTKMDESGRITVKKCIKFEKPVYPIMIRGGEVYLAEFDFTNNKKEIKIWKAYL